MQAEWPDYLARLPVRREFSSTGASLLLSTAKSIPSRDLVVISSLLAHLHTQAASVWQLCGSKQAKALGKEENYPQCHTAAFRPPPAPSCLLACCPSTSLPTPILQCWFEWGAAFPTRSKSRIRKSACVTAKTEKICLHVPPHHCPQTATGGAVGTELTPS